MQQRNTQERNLKHYLTERDTKQRLLESYTFGNAFGRIFNKISCLAWCLEKENTINHETLVARYLCSPKNTLCAASGQSHSWWYITVAIYGQPFSGKLTHYVSEAFVKYIEKCSHKNVSERQLCFFHYYSEMSWLNVGIKYVCKICWILFINRLPKCNIFHGEQNHQYNILNNLTVHAFPIQIHKLSSLKTLDVSGTERVTLSTQVLTRCLGS